MYRSKLIEVSRRLLLTVALMALVIGVFPASALAEQSADTMNLATSLLVISFLLSVCILVVSGFTLWQSHRYYLDTVRLSREITATTTELHQNIVELMYDLKDILVHESGAAKSKQRRSGKSQSKAVSGKTGKIADSISETEDKIKALEKTLDKLNEQLSFNFQSSDATQKLSSLSDTEYAVLFKLSQDPRFFEKHSFSSFGATPRVLDSLLSRQLIIFDKDGKAEVPKDVATALRHSAPGN